MPIPPDIENTAEINRRTFDVVLTFRPVEEAPTRPGLLFGPVWLMPGDYGGMVWGYWDGEAWYTYGGVTSAALRPTHWAFRAPV
jgi:hypothetical protein